MTTTTLSTVVQELFDRFELQGFRKRDEIVDDYFVELAKRHEMSFVFEKPGYYAAMKAMVLRHVLPLHDEYVAARTRINERQSNRSMSRYVLVSAGCLEGLAIVLTRGRALAPMLMVPMLLVGSVLGACLYQFAQSKDDWLLKKAKESFFESVAGLDARLLIDREYEAFKEYWGGSDTLKADAFEVISQYTSPDEFWADFEKARSADPVTETDLSRLQLPRFQSFLEPHVRGGVPDQAREHRFKNLFLLAHEIFVETRGTDYVSRVMAARSEISGSEQNDKPNPAQRMSSSSVHG